MTGTARRRRHGLAGLLVALFVVSGLVFTYGLGHAPPLRVCTAHAMNVPAGVADAVVQKEKAAGPASASLGAMPSAAQAPLDLPPLDPAGGCLCLAALITLLVLALAALPTITGRRSPKRHGWAVGPPAPRLLASLSLSSLQVLRL